MSHSKKPLDMVLYSLATQMIQAANAIEQYGNKENATQLRGAAIQVRQWVDDVRADEALAGKETQCPG